MLFVNKYYVNFFMFLFIFLFKNDKKLKIQYFNKDNITLNRILNNGLIVGLTL